MESYKSMFLKYMDSEDIKYTELDEFGVGIVVGGENIDAIRVLVIFEEDGSPALQLRSSNFIGFSGKEIRGIIYVLIVTLCTDHYRIIAAKCLWYAEKLNLFLFTQLFNACSYVAVCRNASAYNKLS